MSCKLGQLLLLLAFVYLLSPQATAAGRRVPLQAVNVVVPTNNQHVQFTVAMKGVTCQQLPASGTQPFTDRFRGQMRLDVINYLTAQGQVQATNLVRSAGDSCLDLIYERQPWASIRAHVWFQNVTTSLYRDTLFNATRERMCRGGYLKTIWANVHQLMMDNDLTVGHNNGSRCPRVKQTKQCTAGWIPYADPNNPNCGRTSPSPQPSPSPSPQPSPSPSPQPSPSPSPVTTIFSSVTDVVINSVPGGCSAPSVDPLHNQILEDYTARVMRRIPDSAKPFTITYKLPCREVQGRRRLLQDDAALLLRCATNTTEPQVQEIATNVGQSIDFKSEVVDTATLFNATVQEIVTNTTESNGTWIIPSSPSPSPSPGPCPDNQLPLFQVVGGQLVQNGCANVDGTSCQGTATLRPGTGSNGGAATGCLQANECPSSYDFSWYIAPTSGRSPVLRECWLSNGGNANCDGLPFSGTNSVVEMAETISPVNAASLKGCTVATAPGGTAFCPGRFRFFAATSSGALPNPVAGEASCASTSPPCTGKVPVIDSPNAEASAPILGCLGTSSQLPGATCPAEIPQVLSAASSYTFFIAPGNSASDLVVGRPTSCRRKQASSSCGSLVTARQFTSEAPDGCFSGSIALCPAASSTYTFPMFGPIAGGSAPRLEQCSTAPSGTTCNPAGGVYTVAVTNGGLNGVPAPSTLTACQKPTTACPAGIGGTGATYPLINANGVITDCRSVQTTCPSGSSALCRNAAGGLVPADGSCAVANTMGCVAAGAPRTVACYSRPANGYPTVDGYPIFVASLNAGPPATLKSLAACFSDNTAGCTTAVVQNTTASFVITARTGLVFSGCTDQNAPSCTSWWSGEVGPSGVCSN